MVSDDRSSAPRREPVRRYGIDGVPDQQWNPRPPQPKQRKGRAGSIINVLIYVFGVLAVSVILAFLCWLAADDVLALTGDDESLVVTIDGDDSLEDIADKLKRAGLIEYAPLFRAYGWFSNAEDKIEPGTYELSNTFDYRALVIGMQTAAETRVTVTVTIPEGYEEARIFELLAENDVAEEDELWDTAANYDFSYDFLDELPLGTRNRLEGYLFPDTYEFYVGEDSVSVINKLLANFDRRFDEDMRARIDELNTELRERMGEIFTEAEKDERMLDMHDIVIIASLIEKEAANNSERADVSAVIHNRLTSKLYPTLQIDATVQYALDERKEVLTSADLSVVSPYNTYNNAGLPAGPIANAGLASIRAALFPSDEEYYFYALDTDGSHHFSETYIEHEAFLDSLGAPG